jgi:hypothetical protein
MPLDLTGNKILSTSIGPKGEVIRQIPIDGLVTNFDVRNKNSYSGTGTSIIDLTGRSNGTLFGSPSFSSGDNGGSLTCNTSQTIAVDDKTQYNYFTTWGWIKWNSNGAGESILFNKENSWEMRIDSGVMNWAVWADNQSWFWHDSGGRVTQSTPTFVAYSYGGNSVKTYKNGSLVETYSYPSGGVLANQSSAWPKFNSRDTNFGHGGSSGNNTLYTWAIYNRALTDTEILQTYNTTKSRFGL